MDVDWSNNDIDDNVQLSVDSMCVKEYGAVRCC